MVGCSLNVLPHANTFIILYFEMTQMFIVLYYKLIFHILINHFYTKRSKALKS